MNEECVCAKCHEDYSLRENCEPSKYCDRCAHDLLASAEIRIADAQTLVARWADDAARYDNTTKASCSRELAAVLTPSGGLK